MKKFFKPMFFTLLVIAILAGAVAGGMYFLGGYRSANKDTKKAAPKVQTEFKFNPHIRPQRISKLYPDEYWEAAFNLIDALRKGEDTFKCKSQEAYDWASNPYNMFDFFPPGVYILQDSFKNPKDGFRDGVGKIFYCKDKANFLKKEKAYEKDLMKVINDNVKPSYTDFEKCLALYKYICTTCTYDYDDTDDGGEGEDYVICRPLYEHTGICCEFGDFYSYMLLQCGVDSIPIMNQADDEQVGYHSWALVTIDGKRYHVDPTWGIDSGTKETNCDLRFFMMTDKDREEDGFTPEGFQLYCFEQSGLTATDTRYSKIHKGFYERIDRKKKILYYSVDGKMKKFKYE